MVDIQVHMAENAFLIDEEWLNEQSLPAELEIPSELQPPPLEEWDGELPLEDGSNNDTWQDGR